MNMLSEFLREDSFASYEDMREKFSVKIPENFNFVYDVVDRYARDDGERMALVWCNDEDETRKFTFAELAAQVNKAANFLTANGIGKGDAVMLMLGRRYEFWFLLLALHKIGAVATPATTLLTTSDIVYRNNAASIKMIVSLENEHLQSIIDAAVPQSPTVKSLVTIGKSERAGWIRLYKDWDRASDEFSFAEHPGGQDIMLLYFTSGTAGYPKMVQHNFLYPAGHIPTAKYWQCVEDGGLHLSVAETGWAKAMWGKIYGQWLCGSAVFVYDMEGFVPGKLLEKVAQFKVTTFCAPPTVYRYFVKQDLSKYDLSSLKHCTTAGEALNDSVCEDFLEKTGHKLYEGYGQTETTLVVGNFEHFKIKPGSMGKPSPGYEVDIVNENGESCAPGETGEIVIRLEKGKPNGLFVGYYNDEDLTERTFQGGLYHTGDTAHRDEDGYFWFEGRVDDMIKSSGYRISPFEVENAVQAHPAVLECAVTGVFNERHGQIIKASIVLAPGYKPTRELSRNIKEYLRENTASYKRPRIIEFVPELPKTISGKIQRVVIRRQDAEE